MGRAARRWRRFGKRTVKTLKRGGRKVHKFADKHKTALKRAAYVGTTLAPFVAPELLPFAVALNTGLAAEKGRHQGKKVIKKYKAGTRKPQKTDTTVKQPRGGVATKPPKNNLAPVKNPLM